MSYRYPYGNTEQMNLDWFLKQWEAFKADWAEAEAGIDGSLDAEIAKVEAAMTELYAARDAAAASATAARQSSLDAAAAQVASGNNKTAAQAAETAARGSQQAAAESAQEAQASATGAENSALTATQAANTATQQAAGADAAKGAAEAAQQAAEAAQAAAAQSAGQAGQAATAAGDHADDAADSATLAQQAAQDMSDSVAQITTNKNDISDLKESINNNESLVTKTEFLKGGTPYLSENLSANNLYVSAGSGKTSFVLASDIEILGNTTYRFSAGEIATTIPNATAHNWYLGIYNSDNTNIQNIVQADNIDEFTFTANANADHINILLQITYNIPESGRYNATAYNVQIWSGKYLIDSDLVDVEVPEQNRLLTKVIGNSNSNQYTGEVLYSGDGTGRNYFSSASTSINLLVCEVSGFQEGDTIHFECDSSTLDITPTTFELGGFFIAKIDSNGSTIGYAYFTPDGYYTVESGVARIDIYRTVNYTISASAWGILTTHNVLVTIGDVYVNEELSKIESIESIKRERIKPNTTISGGMANIMRVYNPYADKGQNVYTGQLHCHSKFLQNGEFVYYAESTEHLFEVMAEVGYDFATVTDYSHNGEITAKPSDTHGLVWLCNGQETAPTADSGLVAQHMCVYNCKKVYNFPKNSQPEYIANIVTKDGCACDLAHPAWNQLYQNPEKVAKLRNKIRFCEVYDGLIAIEGNEQYPSGKSTDYAWEIMLDNGCVTWGTAINDSHSGADGTQGYFSKGCVKVFSNKKDAESIWEALCKGAFVASTNVNAMINDISFQYGTISINTGDANATTVFKKENGAIVKTQTGETATYKMQGNEKYVRAIVTLSSGETIWCQPIINVTDYDIDDYEYTY